MKLNHLKLYNKILIVFLPGLLILATLIGILMLSSIKSMMLNQFEKRGVEISERVANMASNAILVNDSYTLYEVVNEVVLSSNDVIYVMIQNYNGRVLAHSFRDGFPKGLMDINKFVKGQSNSNIEIYNSNEGVILDIFNPIEDGEVGAVRIGLSEKNISSEINSKAKSLILITLLVCFVTSLVAVTFVKMITDPVTQLLKSSKEISQGNVGTYVVVKSKDEIGELASQFNLMSDNLKRINEDKDQLLFELKNKEAKRNILLNRLITAQEDERKRISRELHDETSQSLTALIVAMRLLADEEINEYQKEVFLTIRNTTVEILEGVRNLAIELRPPMLDDLGLEAAIEKYISKYAEHYKVETNFTSTIGAYNLSDEINLALYRIMQEGLTNTAKHSNANRISVVLKIENNMIILIVKDNGQGFSEDDVIKAKKKNRIGIYGMQERAELFGGTFSIDSSKTGTSIKVTLPLTYI